MIPTRSKWELLGLHQLAFATWDLVPISLSVSAHSISGPMTVQCNPSLKWLVRGNHPPVQLKETRRLLMMLDTFVLSIWSGSISPLRKKLEESFLDQHCIFLFAVKDLLVSTIQLELHQPCCINGFNVFSFEKELCSNIQLLPLSKQENTVWYGAQCGSSLSCNLFTKYAFIDMAHNTGSSCNLFIGLAPFTKYAFT